MEGDPVLKEESDFFAAGVKSYRWRPGIESLTDCLVREPFGQLTPNVGIDR
jgi:hypothetical protein